MNAKKMEETPKIKVVKEYAKKKAKKKLTLLEISKLIDRANRKGPDSLSPDELEIVNEYAWVEELHGDANAMLQEILFYLEEGPAEGITPEDVLSKVSQKDQTEYRDARLYLMKLIHDLQNIHNFRWKFEKPDRKVKDGYHMSYASICKGSLMTSPRVQQAQAEGLKKLRNLPKKQLEMLMNGIDLFERQRDKADHNPGSSSGAVDTSGKKGDY